jgi:alpha-beta hydrolase superfamily lysophospholipase
VWKLPTRPIIALSGALLALSACGDGGITERTSCSVPGGAEPFTFESGGYRLSGFIDAPPTPGPHPAILLVHDDEPTDVANGRGDYPELREVFRSAGLATVVWDRRGSGCSAGRNRGIADLFLRTDDVLAAVDALRGRADIDPKRIGLWALGRGAYVAPMAAARSAKIAFMIVVGAPGGTPGHEIAYEVHQNLEAEGVPEKDADEIAMGVARAMAAMAEQKNYDAFKGLTEALKQNPHMQRVWRLAPELFPDSERYAEWQESGALDVSPDRFLPALEIPVLALWGNLDSEVDWQGSVKVYREAFARGKNSLDIRVFKDADHRICKASASPVGERVAGDECKPAPDYFDTMLLWLQAHGFAAAAP